MTRVVLFLAANLAIVMVLSLSMRLLGVEPAFFGTYVVAELVLGVLATMIVMWLSRRLGRAGSLEFARN